MAPAGERSLPRIAAGSPPCQPRILPSSVEKMNRDGPAVAPVPTTNAESVEATRPVGAVGTETTSGEAAGNPAPVAS